MPTGYTADVADGKVTDFRTFALRCARQFGATVMQRDEPMDVLPKLREESDYAKKGLAKSEAELARLRAMTITEAGAEQAKEHRAQAKAYNEMRRDMREKRGRYTTMLASAREWTPPTAEHGRLKQFMIDQLEESIKYDCNDEWLDEKPLVAVEVWLKEKQERELASVKRYAEDVAAERVRVAAANAWIRALWAGLPRQDVEESVPA